MNKDKITQTVSDNTQKMRLNQEQFEALREAQADEAAEKTAAMREAFLARQEKDA